MQQHAGDGASGERPDGAGVEAENQQRRRQGQGQRRDIERAEDRELQPKPREIDALDLMEQRVEREPHGEIEDDAGDRRRDGGERPCERLVSAQLLDIGAADENPQETGAKVTQVARRPASAPASSGGRPPGS